MLSKSATAPHECAMAGCGMLRALPRSTGIFPHMLYPFVSLFRFLITMHEKSFSR